MVKRRRPSPPSGSVRRRKPGPTRSSILVTGSQRKLLRVALALSELDARVSQVPWDEAAQVPAQTGVIAVVLVAPVPPLPLKRAAETVLMVLREVSVPLFVLTELATTDRDVRALYRAGATAVLQWPREEKVLSALLAELLGIRLVRGPTRRVDTALARAVRAHLRLFGGTIPGLRVSVRGGVARLAGNISSLERKLEIERMVARVPGIIATDTADLHVIPHPKRSDAELQQAIAATLNAVTETRGPTVTATVQNGHVTLHGTVLRRRELARLERLVSRVHGVRGIESDVTFARRQASPEHAVRARLLARLAAALPQAQIEVSVFAGMAVLNGRVKDLATKRAAHRITSEDDDVARVLNKIRVT